MEPKNMTKASFSKKDSFIDTIDPDPESSM